MTSILCCAHDLDFVLRTQPRGVCETTGYIMELAPLPNAIILLVSGRDAPRYLDARLSNSIRTLAPHEGCLAACLTPQARTQGVFWVYRLQQEQFLLLCDGGTREVVISELKRFIVADRVTVEDLSDSFRITHAYFPAPQTQQAEDLKGFWELEYTLGERGGAQGDRYVIPRRRSLHPGCDLVCTAPQMTAFLQKAAHAGVTPLSAVDLQFMAFEAAIPTFPAVIQENSFFPEARLDDALSFNKGCYVGQEAIERLYALGKLPKEIWFFRIGGAMPLVTNAPIFRNGSEERVGRVIASVTSSSETLIAAEIKSERLEEGDKLCTGEHPLHRVTRSGISLNRPASVAK